MSEIVSISTKKLKNRRTVDIEGHTYTVRKFGNLEQLDVEQYMRRLYILAEEENNLKEGETISKEKLDEVNSISRKMTELFVGLFDDGEDGKKSYKLVSSLDGDEITELLDLVFKDKDDSTGTTS